MDNKNNNQTNLADNNQQILDQYASSIKADTPETNSPLNLPKSETKESLKDFNSTSIDTPTPTPLSENLEPSKSLVEDTSPIVEDKTESTPELDFKTEPTNLIIPEPEVELKPELETKLNLEPEPKPESESEEKYMSESETKTEPEAELKSVTDIEENLNIDSNAEPAIQTETNLPSPPSEDPEMIKQKIAEVLSYKTENNTQNPQSDKPKTSRLVKFLFTFSLIIFLLVAAGLVYFIINPNTKTKLDNPTTPNPTPVSTQTGVTCELNGFIYNEGQSFPSADGCNTCTCESTGEIGCTEKDCTDITITSATKSAAKLTTTPISANKAELNTDSYIGETPFDPDNVKIGDTIPSIGRKVYEKTINKYFFTKIITTPIDVDGSGERFIFDKNKKVVCFGIPCCFPGEEDKVNNEKYWQEEWCTGY